jgi:hypothetical protein
MRKIVLAATAALGFSIFGFSGVAEAGQSCKKGYSFSYTTDECVKDVQRRGQNQDTAASRGPQWGPVNETNCNEASDEMDTSMSLCRSYDIRAGKSNEQCAKCCRQLREGARRWKACHSAGFAPAVDWHTINASKKRLGCDW